MNKCSQGYAWCSYKNNGLSCLKGHHHGLESSEKKSLTVEPEFDTSLWLSLAIYYHSRMMLRERFTIGLGIHQKGKIKPVPILPYLFLFSRTLLTHLEM